MNSTLSRFFIFLTVIVLLVLAGWFIYGLWSVFVLLLLSALIAYILDPMASYLEFRGLSRLQATLAVLIVLSVLIVGAGYWLGPLLIDEIVTIQERLSGEKANAMITRIEEVVQSVLPFISVKELQLTTQVQAVISHLSDYLFTFLVNFISIISGVVVIPFAVFFLLKDGRQIKKSLVSMIPNRYFEMGLNMLHKIDGQLGGYLRGIFIDALLVGLLAIGALWLLDVQYFILIGSFAGLANIIPYVGPLSGAIVATGFVLFNNGSGQEVLAVVVAFGIIQLIDNVLIQPLVLARSVNLHPLVIIFAIIAGGQFFGIAGMIIAVPFTGIIKVVSQEAWDSIQRYHLV